MAIVTEKAKEVLLGNDSCTEFSVEFKCACDKNGTPFINVYFADVDTESEIDPVLLTYGIDYRVDNISDTGFRVIYPVSGTPLPAAKRLIVIRQTPLVQDVFSTSVPERKPIENIGDYLMMIMQEEREVLKRTPKISIDSDDDPDTIITEMVSTANSAVLTAANAVTTAEGAVSDADAANQTANAANETAGNAATLASQLEQLVNQKVNEINAAVLAVAEKVDRDGTNVDRLPFLTALGISPEGDIDFSDFAFTSGGNIDVAAYRFGLGIDELDNKVGVLESSAANTNGSNIDTAAYSEKLGLGDLANTAGTNIDVVGYKAALAPRIVTTLAGITGNYVGEQVLRISGVAEDPDDDIYFWDGSNWCKEGI